LERNEELKFQLKALQTQLDTASKKDTKGHPSDGNRDEDLVEAAAAKAVEATVQKLTELLAIQSTQNAPSNDHVETTKPHSNGYVAATFQRPPCEYVDEVCPPKKPNTSSEDPPPALNVKHISAPPGPSKHSLETNSSLKDVRHAKKMKVDKKRHTRSR